MKTLLFSLLLALSLPAAGQTPPAASQDATSAITQLREGIIARFRAGDIDGLLSYLDPQVVVTWQNGEVCRGPEEVRAYYNRMLGGDQRMVRELKSDPEILGREIHGDWAVSTGNLHDHFVLRDGSDLPFNSVFTATIAKRGDRWLVVSYHASVNVFENPVLAMTRQRVGWLAGAGGAVVGLALGFGFARLRARRPTTT